MKRLLFICAMIAAIPASARIASAQNLGIAIGKRAPSAMTQDLNGKPVNLGSYVGKGPMLVEFWATWCSSCMKLEPSLIAAHRKYGKRMNFLSVAVSANQSLERVRMHAARHGLKHKVLYDNTGDAIEAYEVPATSYIVVIDKLGKVVYTGMGGDQNLEAAIKRAL